MTSAPSIRLESPTTPERFEHLSGPSPLLVLGLGNILLRDEGVGVFAVRSLRQRMLPAQVEALDGGTFGLDLLDAIADRDKVVVIDAIDADLPSGTIVRLREEQVLPTHLHRSSLHDSGLAEVLRVARLLGCAPREVIVIGVVPELVAEGLGLSPRIDALLPDIVEIVLKEIATTVPSATEVYT